MRFATSIVAVLATGALLAGCGGDGSSSSPPGSPDNPLVGKEQPGTLGPAADAESADRQNESVTAAPAGTATAPSYDRLLKRQKTAAKPRSRFTPCNLVTRAQAQAIMDQPVDAPREAPQGPTCIYRTSGGRFVTLSVQAVGLDTLRRHLRQEHDVTVGGHAGVCGSYGQPMLYVPLAKDRVLSVTAPCAIARRFAAHAVRQLGS